jgi:sulfoxide reductase catalytic subunit YedY
MLIKYKADIRPSDITDPGVYARRREFLKAAAALGIGAALSASSQAVSMPGQFAGRLSPARGGRIAGIVDTPYGDDLDPTAYEHVTGYNNFYEFGTDKDDPARHAHALKTRPWTVAVGGECEAPGEIGIEDLLSGYPQEERVYRLRCVEAWAMVVPWVGFPLSSLLQRFKPTSRAKYAAFETLMDPAQMPGQRRTVLDWPYREGLRMDEAMHPLTILATGVYGDFLPNQNGAPLRLVVPWKYGFKSIKSIVRISFVQTIPETTWWKQAPGEYGFYANVNPAVDHPRWSQAQHRVIGEGLFSNKQPTLMFNGYADQVAGMYRDMDLNTFF